MGITGIYEGYINTPSIILDSSTDNTDNFTSNASIIIEKQYNRWYFTLNSNGTNGYIRTGNAFNLTNYLYLKSSGSVSKASVTDKWTICSLCVSSNPNFNGFIAESSPFQYSTSKSTIICNISNITGMYYIYFHIQGDWTSGANIYSITLSNS